MNNKAPHIHSITIGSQLRALWAVARKDWKIYWRYPLNAVSSIFQPIIWVTPAYFMGKAFSIDGEAVGFAAYSGSSDYMSFIILGMALSSFVTTVFWGMGYAMKNDMDAGVLESNWLSPTPRILLLVGRTFTSMFTTTITSLAILLVAALLFGFQPTGNALAAILVSIPMLLGLYGFGFAFASLVLILREANMLVDMSSFLVQLLSGSTFPVAALPRWLLPLALALPVTYGFDAARGFLLKTKTILPMSTEIIILLVTMVIMIILGSLAFRALERRVRMLGTLGQH